MLPALTLSNLLTLAVKAQASLAFARITAALSNPRLLTSAFTLLTNRAHTVTVAAADAVVPVVNSIEEVQVASVLVGAIAQRTRPKITV